MDLSCYSILDAMEMIDYKKDLLKKSEKVDIDDPVRLAQILLGRGVKEIFPEVSSRRNKYTITIKTSDMKTAYIFSVARNITSARHFNYDTKYWEESLHVFPLIWEPMSNRSCNLVESASFSLDTGEFSMRIYSMPFSSNYYYNSSNTVNTILTEYRRGSYKNKLSSMESAKKPYAKAKEMDLEELKALNEILNLSSGTRQDISDAITGRDFIIDRDLVMYVASHSQNENLYSRHLNLTRIKRIILSYYGVAPEVQAPTERNTFTTNPQPRMVTPPAQNIILTPTVDAEPSQRDFDAILLSIINQRRNEA